MNNPLYAAANAARMARYARPSQSGYEPQVAQAEESDKPEPVQKSAGFAEPSSILRSAGSAAASGLSATANALDLLGSVGRDVATWLPGGMKPQNPLDQLLDPFGANAHENRIEGRDLLRSYGLAGKKDTWGNFTTGLVLEMATDPLTYTGLGVAGKGANALSKAGILTDKAGLLKEMAEVAGRSGAKIGKSGSAKKATVRQVFDHYQKVRDNIIKNATDAKIEGKRLSGKNTYSSVKELEELNPAALKPNHWAVVDQDGKYSVFQWKVDEKDVGKWEKLDEPSEAIMANLQKTNTAYTLDTIRNAYKSQYSNMYRGEDPMSVLDKPLESIVSLKVPFGTRTLDLNVPDAGPAFTRWLKKQPEAIKTNAPKDPLPADPTPVAGGTKQKTSFDDELEANADKWGLRNADGTIKESAVGPEATRVLRQAAKVFGPQAVDTWDVIETAGVGAARLRGIEPEEFFKNLSIDTGTAKDKAKLQKGTGLEQLAQDAGLPLSVRLYSKFQNVLDSKVGGKISWEQLQATAKKAGVKDEELDDLGIAGLFSDGKPKTKAEVQKWVDENKVDIEVVEQRNLTPEERDIAASHVKLLEDMSDAVYTATRKNSHIKHLGINKILDIDSNPLKLRIGKSGYAHDPDRVFLTDANGKEVTSVLLEKDDSVNDAIKRFYESPGNWDRFKDRLPEEFRSVYDEHSKKLDDIISEARKPFKEKLSTLPEDLSSQISRPQYEAYSLPGGDKGTYREILIKSPANANHSRNFNGPHFDHPNVIAHLRADDITLPGGKKAMRVQELQSDWHQKGKKLGYEDEGLSAKNVGSAPDEYPGEFTWEVFDKNGKSMGMVQAETADDAIGDFMIDMIPRGPFKKSWATLALKQVLKEAVEKGYDEVHIARGADSAKAVGGPEEALGTFYDTILTGDMKKLTKKWGSFQGVGHTPKATGAVWSPRPGDDYIKEYRINDTLFGDVIPFRDGFKATLIRDYSAREFPTLEEARKWIESKANTSARKLYSGDTQVFEITPQMRKDLAEEGLPLYQKTDAGANGAIFINGTRMAIKAFETGNISTLHHEFGHAMRRMLDGDTLSSAEKAIAARMKKLGIEGPVSKDGKWTREAEEVWARSWERYLKEGKSPVKGLEAAFAKLKQWLTDIYRSIVAHPSLGKKLDKKTRDIFDKILREGDDTLRPPKAAGAPPVAAAAAVPSAAPATPVANVTPGPAPTASPSATKAAGEPPVAEGMTRLYHGSATPGRTEGKAWFSTHRPYAENYRGKETSELQYVDMPTELVNKNVDPDNYGQTVDKGFTWNVELDSSVTGPRKTIAKATPKPAPVVAAKAADELPPATADIADDVAKDIKETPALAPRVAEAAPVASVAEEIAPQEGLLDEIIGEAPVREDTTDFLDRIIAKEEAVGPIAAPAAKKAMAQPNPLLEKAKGPLPKAAPGPIVLQKAAKAAEPAPKTNRLLDAAKKVAAKTSPVEQLDDAPYEPPVINTIEDAIAEIDADPRASVVADVASRAPEGLREAVEQYGRQKIPAKESQEIDAIRKGIRGDADALTELGLSEAEIKSVMDDMQLMKSSKEKAAVLASRLNYPNPKEIADKVAASKAVVEEDAAIAAKAKADAKRLEAFIRKNGVIEAMLDKVGSAANAADAAKAILATTVGSKLAGGGDVNKLHELLMRHVDDYSDAVEKMQLRDTPTARYDATDKNAIEKVIDDLDFATVPENDILSPAPRRITKEDGPDIDAKAISENERVVDRHLFRKMHYLKSQGRTGEAQEVVNELAEHYMHLPSIVTARQLNGVNNKELYDEFFQNASYEMLNALHRFDYTSGNKFGSFATNYLRLKNLDYYRKKSKRIMAAGGDGKDVEAILTNLKKNTVDDIAENNMADVLRSVSPESAKMLKLKAAGYTHKEIADQLGVKSVNTVGNRLAKAMKDAEEVALEQASTPKPPKSAMRILYDQNKEAIKKVMDNVQDDSLRAKWTNMMDIGEHLFTSSAPVRAFNRYFDRSVYGQYDYDSQVLARKRYRAAQRAIFESRQLMSAITQAIAENGFLDEYGEVSKLIKSGMKTPEAKKQARDLVNKRNAEIVRYMEEARDVDGVVSGLSRDLFGGEELASEMERLLKVVKSFFPNRLYAEGLAGLSNKKLIDEYIKYFPRIKHHEYGRKTKGIDDIDKLFDASQGSQKKRKLAFRDVPGGRAVLDELSVDPDISGIYWEQLILGKGLSRYMLEKSTQKMLTDQYRLRVFDPAKHFNADGTLNGAGKKKGAQVAAAMAQLPRLHAEKQIPIFGNNILHDISKYIQDSIAMEGVARTAQEVVANNLLPATSPSQYTLSSLFKGINLDRNQAYVNVIESAGRRKEYNLYAKKRLASIKKDLKAGKKIQYDGGKSRLELNENGAIQAVDVEKSIKMQGDEVVEAKTKSKPRIISDADLAEEMNFAREWSDDIGKLTVNKDTFDTATQYLTAWRTPKEIGDISRFFRASMNLFKTNVTIPFLSFHMRNFMSGQVQNYFYGVFSPSSVRQAWDMRNGKSVSGLYDKLPKHIQTQIDAFADGAPQDEAATNWIREQVFKYGITGDKQGYAAEQVGESYSAFVSQYPGYKKREQSAKNLWGLLRNPQAGVSLKDRANLLHTRGSGRPGIIEDDLGKKRIGVKPYEETTSTLHRVGEDLAQVTEDVNRIAPFIVLLKRGMLPEAAAQRVQRVQIDYSNLSETEKAIRNWIPFWTFSSKVMHLTLGDLITNPGGKQAWAIRATNRAQDPESLAPEYLKRGVAIPTGQTATGADRYISGLGLPFEDPLQFAGALRGDFRGAAGEIVGRLRPEVQGLAEVATGRSLFFDRNLDDMDPPVGRLMENIRQGVTGEERKGLAEPVLNSPGLEWLIGKSPASRYIGTAVKATDGRKDVLSKLANIASGIKVTDIEPEARERIAIDMASNLLKEYGGRDFGRTYVPEWAKERLSDERALQVDAIQSFISDVQKETRRRKKAAEGLAGAVSGQAGDFAQ